MFFIFIAKDRPGASALRAGTKARHKAYLDRGGDGVEVLLSGPTLSDDGRETGSVIVVRATGHPAAVAFFDGDPYHAADLFAERDLRPWDWRRGNRWIETADAPSAPR